MELEINILKKTWQNNVIQDTDLQIVKNNANLYPYCNALQLLNNAIEKKQNAENSILALRKAKLFSNNLFLFHHQMDSIVIEKSFEKIENFITPPYVDNYFAFEKIEASSEDVNDYVEQQILQKENKEEPKIINEENSLMITMSFAEWLQYFKEKKKKEEKELESKQAVKALWQKEKLTEAIGEENDVIPENVFKRAIDSMSLPESTVSESLAEIMLKQGKTDKAIEMYKQLSLLNPEKSSYFASKLKNITKNL
jgi:tetratricopeptide (TPR) repeat protein